MLPASEDVLVIAYPDRAMSYRELEAYVVDRLPPDKRITLIAESFSGPIALQLSQRAGINLQAVVLVSSFAAFPFGRIGKLLAHAPWRMALRMRLPAVVMRFFLVGQDASPELVDRVRATIAAVNPSVLAQRVQQALASAYCGKPVHPRCRVLALYSEEDRLLGSTARRSILSICPSAEMRQVGAPHLALQSRPELVNRALRQAGILG